MTTTTMKMRVNVCRVVLLLSQREEEKDKV